MIIAFASCILPCVKSHSFPKLGQVSYQAAKGFMLGLRNLCNLNTTWSLRDFPHETAMPLMQLFLYQIHQSDELAMGKKDLFSLPP